jgi:hypothetical protein
MFGMPLDDITFNDLEAFCRSGVREGVLIDFKKDFPAKLEKTIAAFANTFGGIILIGVDETALGEPVIPICGVPLTSGLRERVIQTGLDAVYPPVIPEVKVVDFKSTAGMSGSDRAVVVVRVHETETGGHAIDKRTTIYLRVENISDPFRRATVDEMEWFINKRGKALEEKNRILVLTREHARQYLLRLRTRNGMSAGDPAAKCVFWTTPRFPRQALASPPELLRLARDFRLYLEHPCHNFPLGSVHPVPEGIFFDGEYYDAYRYTEIHQQGLMYYEYGFWWDREQKWRQMVFPSNIVELLLANFRLASLLYPRAGYWGLLDIEFSLVGVRGRIFYEPNGPSFASSTPGVVDNEITVRETTSVSELGAKGVELARRMMTDIAWAFGVQSCPRPVEQILAKAEADRILRLSSAAGE